MMSLKKNRIFLYDNLERQLLIFLLISELNNNIYICYEKNEYKMKKLFGRKVVLKERIFENKMLNFIFMQLYIKKTRKILENEIKKIKTEDTELFGSDIFWFGKELFYKEKIYVLEDGTANYMKNEIREKNRKKISEILKRCIKNIFGLGIRQGEAGYGDKVKKIYLTENLCKEIPKGLEKKAEIINLKKLWDKKTEEEQKVILDVFDFNPEILKKVNENTVMLFTQPLSEDGVISENEKIELYSKILEKYNNQFVIIKPHPREKTDYSIYFSNCYVMKEKYPVEILELVGINIKKAVTIFSSAAFGLGKNVKIDFYGTEIHKKLFERFGSQDKVMKRNAFLN